GGPRAGWRPRPLGRRPPLPPALAARPRAWLPVRRLSSTVVLASFLVATPPPMARPPLPPALLAPPTAWLPVSIQWLTVRVAPSKAFTMPPPSPRPPLLPAVPAP